MKRMRTAVIAAVLLGVLAVGAAAASGIQQILVDLRPDITVEVDGMTRTMTDKNGNTDENYSDDECVGLPMAVLTNRYSISAAEFFAAAIQEYGVGTVVGEKTGGKGYAQTMMPLSDGSALNISTYRYYTPKGNTLAETGVTPDVEVALEEEKLQDFYSLEKEEDTQLQKAIEILLPRIGAAE